MWNQFLSCEQDDYTQISQDIRKLQNDFLERRLRRPYYSGVTTSGINYIDTRPINNNHNTIISEHHFHPTPGSNRDGLDPLPPHTSITEQPLTYSSHLPQTGTTIVLAHGFSQSVVMWSENIDYFSSIPGVDRVVAFDWRGMGGSERNLAEVPKRSPLTFFEQYRHHDITNEQTQKEKEKKCQSCSIVQKGKVLQQRLREKYNNYGLGDSLPPIPQPDPILSPQSDPNHLRHEFQTHNLHLQQDVLHNNNNDVNGQNVNDPEEIRIVQDPTQQQQLLDINNQNDITTTTTTLPHIPSHFFADSIRTILYPITAYTSDESKAIIEKNVISPIVSLTQSLYKSIDSTLSFDKYVQNSIEKSYTPEKAVNYFIDPLIPMWHELGLDEQPVIIVAHSLGGLLSTHFVHKYPGLVHGLLLASPAGVSEGLGLSKDNGNNKNNNIEHQHQHNHENGSPFANTHTHADFVETLLSSSAALRHTAEQQQQQQHEQQQQQQSKITNESPSTTTTTTVNINDKGEMVSTTTTTTIHSEVITNQQQHQTQVHLPLEEQPPQLIKTMLLEAVFGLWKLNLLQPQTILKIMPKSVSSWISKGLANRMHDDDSIDPNDKDLLATYLESILTAPAVGEYAMNSILHTDYPQKTFSKNLLHDIDTDSDKEFVKFIKHTYDFKRQLMLKEHLEEKQLHDELNLSLEQQDDYLNQVDDNNNTITNNNTNSTNKSNKHGDSAHNKKKRIHEDELLNLGKDIRTPSVFARSPLELKRILPYINIPVAFLYGDDDWLYQSDVPYVIRNITKEHLIRKLQLPAVLGLNKRESYTPNNNNNNNVDTENNNTTINYDQFNSDDISDPTADIHNLNQDPNLDEFTSLHQQGQYDLNTQYEREKALSMLNYTPNITLDIVPNAGHHLYSNNPIGFNLKVSKFVKQYSSKLAQNHHQFSTPYDPSYTKRLLKHYYSNYQYQRDIDNALETKLQLESQYIHPQHHQNNTNIDSIQTTLHNHQQQQLQQLNNLLVEPITQAVHQITSPASMNQILSTTRTIAHGIIDSVFTAITPQPSQQQQQEQLSPQELMNIQLNQQQPPHLSSTNSTQFSYSPSYVQYRQDHMKNEHQYHSKNVYAYNGDLIRQQQLQEQQQQSK